MRALMSDIRDILYGSEFRGGGESATPLSLRQQDGVLFGVFPKKLNLLIDLLLKTRVGSQNWILMAVLYLPLLTLQFACRIRFLDVIVIKIEILRRKHYRGIS